MSASATPHHHEGEPHLHPEHFTLSPEIARLPLARRRKRLGAILIDLLMVLAISNVFRSLGLLAGAAAGALLYWAAGHPAAPAWLRLRSTRVAMALGLCLLLIAAGRWIAHETESAEVPAAEQFGEVRLDGEDLIQLANTDDEEAARRLAMRLATNVKRDDDPQQAARELLAMVDDDELPLSETSRAELVRALAPLRASGSVATGTAALAARVASLEERLEQSEDALQEAREERGVLHFLKATVHDLGFGVGWSYVYFIGFMVLWKGRTPGKRLFGIRVARIDGRPMTLWRSWERFHGYAASLLTGLLGFAQILWDPSRQCLHDKVAETVVVQE